MLVLHPPKLALTQRRVGLMPGGADTPLRPGERGRERECMGSTRGRKQVERFFGKGIVELYPTSGPCERL